MTLEEWKAEADTLAQQTLLISDLLDGGDPHTAQTAMDTAHGADQSPRDWLQEFFMERYCDPDLYQRIVNQEPPLP